MKGEGSFFVSVFSPNQKDGPIIMKASHLLVYALLGGTLAASATYNIIQFNDLRKHQKPPQVPVQQAVQQAAPSVAAPAAAEKKKKSFIPYISNSNLNSCRIVFPSAAAIPEGKSPADFFVLDPMPENFNVKQSFASQFFLCGDFQPHRTYRLKIKPGIVPKSDEYQAVDKEMVFVFLTPEKEPLPNRVSVETRAGALIIPFHSKVRELPIYLSNPGKEVTLKIYKNYENRFLEALTRLHTSFPSQFLENLSLHSELKVPVKMKSNSAAVFGLDLDKAGIPRKPGFYRLEMELTDCDDKPYHWKDLKRDWKNLILTDLAGHVTYDRKNVTVAVNQISTTKPVAGATVKFYSWKKQLLKTAQTDASGLVRISISDMPVAQYGNLKYVILEKGDDRSWVTLSGIESDSADKAERVFVYTARDICAPGEDMNIFVMARNAKDNIVKKDLPLKWIIRYPNWKTFASGTVKTDQSGSASFSVKLPAAAPLGHYKVEICSPDEKLSYTDLSFSVSEYLPDSMKVKLNGILKDQTISAKGNVKFYFGAPVHGGDIRLLLISEFCQFSPKEFKDYTFNAPLPTDPVPQEEFCFTTKMGNFNNSFKLPENKNVFCPLHMTIYATAKTAASGRSVTAVTSGKDLVKHYASCYIGVKTTEHSEKKRTFSVIAVTPDGKKMESPDMTLTAQLLRNDWEYIVCENRSGMTYKWEEKQYPVGEAKKHALSSGTLSFDLPRSGHYTLQLKNDQNVVVSNYNFWSYAGEAGERLSNPNAINFKLDREKVIPGETVNMTFYAPDAGSAILSTGVTGIDQSRTFAVVKGENKLAVTVPASVSTGSYYTNLTVVTSTRRLSGIAELIVDQTARRLNVAISAPEKINSAATADVKITLKNAKTGKPAAGTVQLWAVDSGILALTGFKTPDPFKAFFGRTDDPINTADEYDRIFNSIKLERKLIGGGGLSSAAKKYAPENAEQRQAPAIFMLDRIQVPASGEITIPVKFPAHTGSMRIMATASGTADVGSGNRDIILRDAIALKVSAPRVLAPGDDFQISLDAFNLDFPDGTAEWKINGKTGTVKLAKGGSESITVIQKAEKGKKTFDYNAELTMNGKTVSTKGSIVIRSPLPAEDVMTIATVKQGETAVYKTAGEFDVVEVGSPVIAISGALRYLNEYPYGCLEQTSSTAFPHLATPYLVKAGLLDPVAQDGVKAKIEYAMAHLETMYRSGILYAMWEHEKQPWKEGSLYAIHFQLEAKKAGMLDLPDSKLRDIDYHLSVLINSRYHDDTPAIRAYAIYILSLLQPAKAANFADYFLAVEENIAPYNKFMAAIAMINGGKADTGMPILRDLMKNDFWLKPHNNAGLGLFDDATRRLGLAIWCLADIVSAEELTKLATALQKRINNAGHWSTTQANAWAIMGLARWAEKNGGKPVADITVNGKTEKFAGKVLRYTGADKTVSVKNNGTAPVLITRYERKVPETFQPVSNGFSIKKEYLNASTKQPLSGKVRMGDLITVRLTINAPEPVEDMVVSDLLPGGFEIEDEKLLTRMGRTNIRGIASSILERRYDRFLFFGTLYGSKDDAVIEYNVRAVTKGTFAVPPVLAEAMYAPDVKASARPVEKIVIE